LQLASADNAEDTKNDRHGSHAKPTPFTILVLICVIRVNLWLVFL